MMITRAGRRPMGRLVAIAVSLIFVIALSVPAAGLAEQAPDIGSQTRTEGVEPTVDPDATPTAVPGPGIPTGFPSQLNPQDVLAGQMTVDLPPSNVLSREVTVGVRRIPCGGDPDAPGLLAGWVDGRCGVRAAQTVAQFNLAPLQINDQSTVLAAVLSWDESEVRWTNGQGGEENLDGCVSTLGIASVDPTKLPPSLPFPSDPFADASPANVHQFDVRDAVIVWNRLLKYTYGYVLGGVSPYAYIPGDAGACLSSVSNFNLHVVYIPGPDYTPVPTGTAVTP